MNRTYFLGVLVISLVWACNDPETEKPQVEDTVSQTVPVSSSAPTSSGYRFETFANLDSVGNQLGYGYDIFDGDKKLIHQTNIPGEPGVAGFVSDKEAGIIAAVVIEKLKAGGGMPTITHIELIDYGITLKQ
jgi:hypothetical protein